MRLLRLLLHLLVVRPVLRLLFGLDVEGKENLEGLDQFILVANHNSHLDVLLLYSLLPVRHISRTHPVAAREYFERSRVLFFVIDRMLEPIWIDRSSDHGAAIVRIEHILDQGRNVILFPEGTRGEPGHIHTFKSGIGRLVESHRDIPVVPIHILGPERSLPKGSALPLPLWNHLTISPPQRLTGSARDVAQALEDSIRSLASSQAARRHHRPSSRRECFSVAVLGIDGSGKSTLAGTLARQLSGQSPACLISDRLVLFARGAPTHMQPLLAEKLRVWLGRQAKQARSLAGYKIPKLGEMLLRDRLIAESRRWYAPGSIIQDGSPLMNLTAWSALYQDDSLDGARCAEALMILSGRRELSRGDPISREHPELGVLRTLGISRLFVPDAVVFLDVSPCTALKRIASRGEQLQVHETEDELAKLRDAYVLVCEAAERALGIPVLRIEGEVSAAQTALEALSFIREQVHVA